jgi:DNA-binding transcriptional LysR family regulator
MKDLNEIQCFVKAVELKSLTAAAKALDLPKSSVSRKISNLEKRMGTTLVVRTTRALNLTDKGRQFFQTVAPAIQEVEAAEKGIDTSRETVEGPLRVTAPVEFALGPFPKLIAGFLKAYPKVTIDLVLTERVVDLVTEGFDVAFRMGELDDSTLVAKKLPPLNAHIVASPKFLKERGEPKNPSDIDDHEWLNFSPDGTIVKWTLKSPDGKKTINPRGPLSANHFFALKQAVVEGLGFAVVPAYMVEDDLKNKTLKIVCDKWELDGGPAHIVFPPQKFLSLKLRRFIDYSAERFQM